MNELVAMILGNSYLWTNTFTELVPPKSKN